MTLREISADYRASAQTLRLHLRYLRRQARETQDKEELWRLKMRNSEGKEYDFAYK